MKLIISYTFFDMHIYAMVILQVIKIRDSIYIINIIIIVFWKEKDLWLDRRQEIQT